MKNRLRRKNNLRNQTLAIDMITISLLIIFSLTYFYLDNYENNLITGYNIFKIQVADTAYPNITINSPANNSNFSYTNITFNITAEEVNLINNISIFGNWTGEFQINITNSSFGLANNATQFTINISQGRGYYLWSALACDNSSNCNYSSNNTIFINRIPEITSINISNDHSANKSTGNLTGQLNYLDADGDSNQLNETRWYNNSIEITLFKNFTQINYLNMTNGDNWIFSARVFDGDNWSIWYNSSGHSIQNNSAPSFTGLISNQSWVEDTSLDNAINLSAFFTDLENNNLNYSVIGNKAINVSITNGIVSFSQVIDFFGTEYVVFEANDSNLTRRSNNVTLTIESRDDPSQVSIGGGGKNVVSAVIEVISPGTQTIFLKDKTIAQLIIKNKGNFLLQGINLKAVSDNENIKTVLTKTFIPSLSQGAEEKIDLEIISSLNKDETSQITIFAEVNLPKIKDSTTIYLNAIEFGAGNKTMLVPRLQYARDLFGKNEECQNLRTLIEKAESFISEGKFNEAGSLIEKAINGCNDIVVLKPKRLEVSVTKLNENLILLTEILALMMLILGFLYYKKKRKFNS